MTKSVFTKWERVAIIAVLAVVLGLILSHFI